MKTLNTPKKNNGKNTSINIAKIKVETRRVSDKMVTRDKLDYQNEEESTLFENISELTRLEKAEIFKLDQIILRKQRIVSDLQHKLKNAELSNSGLL